MEHRYSTRKPLVLDVVIGYSALGLVHGQTRDISLGGMFVKTGCIELPVNALVEASLMLDNEGQQEAWQTKAMVVHNHPSGAGLMFNDLDEPLHCSLRGLILGSEGGEQAETDLTLS